MTLPKRDWFDIFSIYSPCCSSSLQWSCDCNKHLLPLLLALDYNNCTATCYCVLCIDNDNKTTSVETSCINSLQICQDQPSPASRASSCIVFSNFDSDIHGYSKCWEKPSGISTMKVPANVSSLLSISFSGGECESTSSQFQQGKGTDSVMRTLCKLCIRCQNWRTLLDVGLDAWCISYLQMNRWWHWLE